MSLIKFRDYLGKKGDGKSPPSVIKAKDLDDNFAMLELIPDKFGIYKVEKSEKGSTLSFTAANRAVRWIEIDICVDGTAKKMMVLGTDPY
jgi:hypothetical protein